MRWGCHVDGAHDKQRHDDGERGHQRAHAHEARARIGDRERDEPHGGDLGPMREQVLGDRDGRGVRRLLLVADASELGGHHAASLAVKPWRARTASAAALARCSRSLASHVGRYDNHDPAWPALPDVFAFRARMITDEQGRYEYETIQPGPYAVGPKQWRAPHIHYWVNAPGFAPLVTHYFRLVSCLRVELRLLRRADASERAPQ